LWKYRNDSGPLQPKIPNLNPIADLILTASLTLYLGTGSVEIGTVRIAIVE